MNVSNLIVSLERAINKSCEGDHENICGMNTNLDVHQIKLFRFFQIFNFF